MLRIGKQIWLLLLVLVPLLIQAQNYYAIRSDGAVPQGYFLDKIYETDKTILLNQPTNNVMSSVYALPFSFNFYGKSYTSYRVSENGYLSFNTQNSTAEVPDTILPSNSICVFGRDFKLQLLPEPNTGIGTQVFAYTVGKAPQRRHIVQYYGLTLAEDPLDKPINNASLYAFAIVFHEGSEGRFDFVYSPYGNKLIQGAIGCASDSGNMQFLLDDTLKYLPFQFSFDPVKFIVYEFYRGIQPEYDLEIKDLVLQSMYPVNTIVNFNGRLRNNGSKSVSTYYLNYSVNGADTVSYFIDDLVLDPSGQGNAVFAHPISWLGGAAGSVNQVNFWISEPDGRTDENAGNSHYSKTILRTLNNNTIDRNVLIEEGTGAWCGYCPDAHLLISDAVKKYGNRIIPVAYHFDDSMSNAESDVFLDTYIRSYPDAMLDRKVFLGSNSTWAAEIESRVNSKVPVELSIDQKTFDASSREIRFRVQVRFTDYWYGKLSIGSIVTENKVRGNEMPNIWSQNNYYSRFYTGGGAGGPLHRLYNEQLYMHGYIHNYVHKASPGGVWGVHDTIPEFVHPGEVYYCDFSYTLPEPAFVKYSAENNTPYCSTLDRPGENEGRNIPAAIQLIGYVSEVNDDYLKRPVVNAISDPLWNFEAGLQNHEKKTPFQLYPNPAADAIVLKSLLDMKGELVITVFNTNLQSVLNVHMPDADALNYGLPIDTTHWPEGVYVLMLKQNDLVSSVRIVISRH